MFSQNIVWKRLNVQEGGKTRLSITEEERVICFCPIMRLKTQCCSWCIWTLNTSPNQEHNGKPCKDKQQMMHIWTNIVLKTSCEVPSHLSLYFHFSCHAKAKARHWWMQMGHHHQTWLISAAPTTSRWPITGGTSQQTGVPHPVCF